MGLNYLFTVIPHFFDLRVHRRIYSVWLTIQTHVTISRSIEPETSKCPLFDIDGKEKLRGFREAETGKLNLITSMFAEILRVYF